MRRDAGGVGSQDPVVETRDEMCWIIGLNIGETYTMQVLYTNYLHEELKGFQIKQIGFWANPYIDSV